ncbi:MAG: glycogen debranching enzyme family protein [Candidatus Eisenbacteria bacterium]|uniref:Glycogen debranching enzyme family protein n=1 Tax=Eiseniibacteriota bacterium TaxID=2212470 RepID=A0A956LXW9_UNCEI|nr:glycogen debranching enzyme family protein [Candidatus Eisenbacteria bacterium]
MSSRLDSESLRDLACSGHLEWLETNGLGGWSSSTLSGMHTRRYHGLFVAALDPPVQRMVLLSRLDETIVQAEERVELGCAQFPGTVHPRGYEHLVAFEQDPFPCFTYEAAGVRLVKTIAALHDRNTVLIDYYVEQASRAFALELRPLLAGRDVHELRRLSRTDVRLQLRHAQFVGDTLQVLVPLVGELEIKVFAPRASFRDEPAWWHDFQYVEEQRRGYDFEEDLWTPGLVSIPAFSGDRFTVMVSLGSFPDVDPASLWQEERTRRETLVAPGIEPDSRVARMVRAADQFVVRRAPRSRTVIAGYPWFSDWGRDAMIALPGLCLVTGRHEDAREIFLTFLDHLSDGQEDLA